MFDTIACCFNVIMQNLGETYSVRRSLLATTRGAASLEVLLARLPADDPNRTALWSRAKTYSQDCGCKMGAAFLAGALVIALMYFIFVAGITPWTGIAGIAFVFLAAILGKTAGLALASLKLMLLRRSISRKLQAEKPFEDVYVH